MADSGIMTSRLGVAVRAWSSGPFARDVLLAAALLAAGVLLNDPNAMVGGTLPGLFDDGRAGRIALWWVATAAAATGVALRGRWPVPMLALCAVGAATHLALVVPLMVPDLSVLILLYTVAARLDRMRSLAALTGLLLAATGASLAYALNAQAAGGLPDALQSVVAVPMAGGGPTAPVAPGSPEPIVMVRRSAWSTAWSGLPVIGSVLVAAWAVGAGARNRRAYLDELRARAHDLERERDQRAALAVADERGRISRELHDVVAHGLSVVVIQAQGAAAALDARPAETGAALDAIVRTGRDALADMRRVLAAVDQVDDPWHPQPGLAHLPALVARVRQAGTPVRLRIEGTAAALPAPVDLSAYRIVQEALTNTMKHASTGATADVVLRYENDEIFVDVRDDGHGTAVSADGTGGVGEIGRMREIGRPGDKTRAPGAPGGNGLPGMRERVRLLGGRLTAGPAPGGGFVVRAALPIAANTWPPRPIGKARAERWRET
ncbi:Histidine kinase-, DNA gyrase B-, and HSP90-like ATPase [Parafrankia irregularis]|uniref:histidine kinase n=1 Tax=Parafrankia irregularis TaxID=795642 RepID=A0A0S4R0M1_9ACTN|nr:MULTISPECIES: sensor histidine kinase [Parafrankia]MBE3200372.1 sensor histidine kinase [Parafrankia sp. CH37]CUU61049.1 Histidine kinase-, DNA gyrase B-, and HSP90-like ATPase [Parafrankia irregularis]